MARGLTFIEKNKINKTLGYYRLFLCRRSQRHRFESRVGQTQIGFFVSLYSLNRREWSRRRPKKKKLSHTYM